MSPEQAAKDLLEALGDGQHVLKQQSESHIAYRKARAEMREMFSALVLLSENLRQGVAGTELQGWAPELRENAGYLKHVSGDNFMLVWDKGAFTFYSCPEGVRYTYHDLHVINDTLHTIPRMVGETLAEAAVRLVYNALRPAYDPRLAGVR
jgi:hypothetical protein